ncbi:MAG: nicotinate phosphoribosyltransferase, partial [Acidimicrobiales bacterium]
MTHETSRATGGPPPCSSALHTDHYELTMVETALRSGIAHHRAVFEVFARRLPPGRRYGVLAGVGRLAQALRSFRFGEAELAALDRGGALGPATAELLASYSFGGCIHAYAEGDLFFPGSPVVTVEGGFAEALVLETLILSVLNHDSAVASAAARMVAAAEGRPLIEMGSRRTHEEAAVAAARAAYVAGFATTSNLEAGRRYGIPTAGTAAHALILAHPDERAAFVAQIAAQGAGTTLLVDTYDIAAGIRAAVEVAGDGLGSIRIDSGDLADEALRARALLDSLGARHTKVVVSGDLDEYGIEELAPAPVDAYGVGTKLVGGSGAPTANFVYKLVAIADRPGDHLRPVAKRSASKGDRGGRKWAARVLDKEGFGLAEVVGLGSHPGPGTLEVVTPAGGSARPLQVPVVTEGRILPPPSLEEVRAHHRSVLAELRPLALMLVAGPPALETRFLAGSPLTGEGADAEGAGALTGEVR